MGFFDDLAQAGKEALGNVKDAASAAAQDLVSRQLDDWFRGGDFNPAVPGGFPTFPNATPSTDGAGAPAPTGNNTSGIDVGTLAIAGLILVLALR